MATPIILPKLGNTVESSIILQWYKAVGDYVAEGDILCEVETDKTTVEVESTATGTLLAHFFAEGDDVPVMVNIAVIGESGESYEQFRPETNSYTLAQEQEQTDSSILDTPIQSVQSTSEASLNDNDAILRISPRARNLAQRKQVDINLINGTGPNGRIIERDIEKAILSQPALTPVAKAMLNTGEFTAPQQGTGTRGRITKADLIPVGKTTTSQPPIADEVEIIKLKGIRKTIARRMLESVQTTAQLTLSTSANAQGLLDFRKWLKNSPTALNLKSITINDLILFAVIKTLPEFPELNALFEDDTIYKYSNVHLGFAVDTPRGLLVPVIQNAHHLNLMQLANEAHRLADASLNNTITPDEMVNGTFTVSNLGNLGIEVFTPVLNPPQVGILGVGSILPKPIQTETGYNFVPHITLSLTINHQVVDGAPAARFLKQLSNNLNNIQELES